MVQVVLCLFESKDVLDSRAYDPRGHGIDANVVVGQFTIQGPDKLGQRSLGHTVRNRTRTTSQATTRRNQNNRALTFALHVGHGNTTQVKHGVNVHSKR